MKAEFPTRRAAEKHLKLLLAQEGRCVLCPLIRRACDTGCASFQKAYIVEHINQLWLDDDDFESRLNKLHAEGYVTEEYNNQMVYYVYIVAGHRCENTAVNEPSDWL